MDGALAQVLAGLPAWLVPAAAGGALLVALIVWRVARSARALESLAREVQGLAHAQVALSGGLGQVAQAQAQVGEQTERRLTESGAHTAQALGALAARLEAIDRAQANITRLSGDVLGLQDILSNKQARGAFGEIQLEGLLRDALPPDAYTLQATLSNRRRADALVHLPRPPGPIAIDSKFPLEAYEALVAAQDDRGRAEARRALKAALRVHVRAVAERYILQGETAEGAILFLPSEAIYAEMHANLPEVVREGFALKVWIVSPSTCMAILTTMRAVLRDARVRDAADEIRKALALLTRDVALVQERAAKVESHFDRARGEVDALGVAAARAQGRAARLEALEFDDEDLPAAAAAAPGDNRAGPLILRG